MTRPPASASPCSARQRALKATGPNGRPQQHYALTTLGARLIGREAAPVLKDSAVDHRLAVVDFGTALLRVTRDGAGPKPGWALQWDAEGAALPDGGRPDSRIALSAPSGSLSAWVELDRGTGGGASCARSSNASLPTGGPMPSWWPSPRPAGPGQESGTIRGRRAWVR